MNKPKYIDLHVHSTASDGTDTPSQVIHKAYEAGLSAVALTDHDTVSGVAEAMNTALPIEVIPGIELSAGYGDGDIHILGLYIDYTSSHLHRVEKEILAEREWRNEKMAANLTAAGIDITVEKVRNGDDKTVVTRAHFARYLEDNGYVKNKNEAFKKYLGTHTPYFVKRKYLTPEQCVQLILDCNGIPVLAHPVIYNLPSDELEALIIRLKNSGLAGLEAIYSTYSNADEEYVRSLAHRHSLLITGGSDYHGSNKPDISIGTGRGRLHVPYSVLTVIKETHPTQTDSHL